MSAGRSVTRRRSRHVLPAGLGGLACVACCTVPLLIAGGLTISSAGAGAGSMPGLTAARHPDRRNDHHHDNSAAHHQGPGAASDAQGSGKPRPARVSPHQRLKIHPDPHSHTEPHSNRRCPAVRKHSFFDMGPSLR